MKTYKYQLRKGSRKEICPNCGQKRFVPYVLASDGVTLAGAEFGRCDREQNCGYQRYPGGERYTVTQPQKIQLREPLLFNGDPSVSSDSTLFEWAANFMGISDAVLAWSAYNVGAINLATIWWQIDRNGQIRTGKIMHYKRDGHRYKSAAVPVTWAHKTKAFAGDFGGEELQQCLFGEHLLNERTEAPVALVESEKTAVVLSRFFPDHIWLATGGSQGIKSNERLAPLVGRKVMLIPDHGQYFAWLRVAEQYGWEISDIMEKSAPFEGADILDLVEIELKKIEKDLVL